MSDELKPCPFCGGSATIGGLVPWAECAECGASGAAESDDATAAAAWNRRVDPQPPAEAQPVGTVAVSGIGHTVNWTYPPPLIGTPLYAHPPPSAPVESYTYASAQATQCAGCGEHKHTPLRIDAMGGYVCLTCIDQKLGSLLGEFGYPPSAPVGVEDSFSAADMADAAGQGFRDGVASVGAGVVPSGVSP